VGGIVRLSVVLLCVSLAGVLAGGWLTGRLGFGLCVIADSLAVGFWALRRDDGAGEQPPQAYGVPTLHDVLERARRAG
jgi:hypothetical protein